MTHDELAQLTITTAITSIGIGIGEAVDAIALPRIASNSSNTAKSGVLKINLDLRNALPLRNFITIAAIHALPVDAIFIIGETDGHGLPTTSSSHGIVARNASIHAKFSDRRTHPEVTNDPHEGRQSNTEEKTKDSNHNEQLSESETLGRVGRIIVFHDVRIEEIEVNMRKPGIVPQADMKARYLAKYCEGKLSELLDIHLIGSRGEESLVLARIANKITAMGIQGETPTILAIDDEEIAVVMLAEESDRLTISGRNKNVEIMLHDRVQELA